MSKIIIGLGGIGASKKDIKDKLAEQAAAQKCNNSDFLIVATDDDEISLAKKQNQGENFDEYALDELIHSYMEEEIEFDEVLDFCDALEPTVENKEMLTESIMCFDIEELYETLFCKFDDLLTYDERAFYRERYKKVFG